MRKLSLFLIACLFMLGIGVKARELEESQGLIPSIHGEALSETVPDRRITGEIDSFSGHSSGSDHSCSSCGN